jgi:hypothetical protein
MAPHMDGSSCEALSGHLPTRLSLHQSHYTHTLTICLHNTLLSLSCCRFYLSFPLRRMWEAFGDGK